MSRENNGKVYIALIMMVAPRSTAVQYDPRDVGQLNVKQ